MNWLLFQISHACHVGGALAGFLVSMLVLDNLENDTKWKIFARKICGGTLILCFLGAVCINIAFPSYYLATEWNFNYKRSIELNYLESVKNYREDSLIRKGCLEDVDCKLLLDYYIEHGTIPNY